MKNITFIVARWVLVLARVAGVIVAGLDAAGVYKKKLKKKRKKKKAISIFF